MITDRPKFTQSASTVGIGVSQLEFGYTFSTDDFGQAEEKLHSWGEPLFRHGLYRDWLEFRLGVSPLTRSTTSSRQTDTTSGMTDLYLGCKIALTPQSGCLPEMALIPQAMVPLGSPAFSADELLPGINWVYSWDLLNDWLLGGSTQFNRRRSAGGESYTGWAQSISLAYLIGDASTVYGEWFALLPHSADTVKPEHYLSAGFTYLISDDVQWDIRAGLGAHDEAIDFFCGLGLSWRFR